MTRAHCLKDDNTPLTRSISILACCISLDTRFSNTALVLWLYTAAVELVRFFFHSSAFTTYLNVGPSGFWFRLTIEHELSSHFLEICDLNFREFEHFFYLS
jgi:hypothetical protein